MSFTLALSSSAGCITHPLSTHWFKMQRFVLLMVKIWCSCFKTVHVSFEFSISYVCSATHTANRIPERFTAWLSCSLQQVVLFKSTLSVEGFCCSWVVFVFDFGWNQNVAFLVSCTKSVCMMKQWWRVLTLIKEFWKYFDIYVRREKTNSSKRTQTTYHCSVCHC